MLIFLSVFSRKSGYPSKVESWRGWWCCWWLTTDCWLSGDSDRVSLACMFAFWRRFDNQSRSTSTFCAQLTPVNPLSYAERSLSSARLRLLKPEKALSSSITAPKLPHKHRGLSLPARECPLIWWLRHLTRTADASCWSFLKRAKASGTVRAVLGIARVVFHSCNFVTAPSIR